MTTDGIDIPGLDVLEEIGRGGFAIVYRAHDSDFGRDVAVKVLQSHLDSGGAARFQRECAAVGAISNHPHIVAVHRSGITENGKAYLVMELLTGGSLAARAANGPLPWREAVSIGVAVAGALETAHRAGVLHRDVKPENVLFSAFQAPVLVDFGIAAVRGGYETRSSTITASLAHAAPEVIAGSRASAASDVYALASTVFFAMAGHAPFTDDADETLVPLIARISLSPPPDLRSHGVPDGVATVVETALAKDAGARPLSAEAFADGLTRAAAESGTDIAPPILPALSRAGVVAGAEPMTGIVNRRRDLVAGPAPAPERSRKKVGLLAGAAAVAVIAIAGSAWSLSGSGRPARNTTALKAASSSSANAASSVSRAPAAKRSTKPVKPAASRSAGAVVGGQGVATGGGVQPGGPIVGGAPGGPLVGQPAATPRRAQPAATPRRAQPAATPRRTQSQARPIGGTAKPQNHAPSMSAISNQQSDELATVSMRVYASDADGNQLSYSASGLPAGLQVSSTSGTISGTPPYYAANVTTDRRQGLRYKSFSVTVRVSDGTTSTSRSFTWQIRDNYRTMPNYYGKYGCNGDTHCSESVPNVSAISVAGFYCTTSGSVAYDQIEAQSVRAGSVIRWGQRINYTYSEASC